MLKNYSFFILLLFCGIIISGQRAKKQTVLTTNYIESATKIDNQKDLETYFSNKTTIKSQEKEIIQKVIYADFVSKSLDKYNPESTKLYKEAIQLSENISNENFLIWLNSKVGFYYYNYNFYPEAMPYFLNAEKRLQHATDIDIIEAEYTLKLNAYFWSTMEDYQKSNEYLLRFLKLPHQKDKNYGAVLNNIANNYRKLNKIPDAIAYLEKTKIAALKINDKLRYAKALGDLAIIEADKKNYTKAEELLKEDIKISQSENNERNTMYAQIELGKIYVSTQRNDEAKKILTDALTFIKTKTYLNGFELDIQKLLLQIAIADKNDVAELNTRRRIENLNNETAMEEGPDAVKMVNWKSQKERVEWKLEAEKNKAEKSEVIKWALLAVSILLIGLVVSVFSLNKRKVRLLKLHYEKQILGFKLEQIESDKKIQSTHNTLASFKSYLVDRNKQINNIDTEINKLKQNKKAQNALSAMEELKISHLMTDENWNKFKEIFIREEEEYYEFVTNNFPGLTESNLRIILLNQLGLSNIEIAQLLGLSVDGVKKSKQRLRKKFDNNEVSIV